MIQFNNQNDWKIVQYQTHDIKAVYNNLGKVWEKQTSFSGRYKLALNDSSVVSAECDASSAITSLEISTYKNSITSVEFGNCLVNIDRYTFAQCSGITSVKMSSSVTTIGLSAFFSCGGLTNIDIPDSVTTISDNAFFVCSGLRSVSIGSGITSIGDNAFNSCTSLSSITINAVTPPALATTYAFSNTNDCPIYVPCESVDAYKTAYNWTRYANRIQCIVPPTFNGKWKATYSGGTTSTAECDSTSAITENEVNLTNIIEVEIGDCVTTIDDYAFFSGTSLVSVEIPDSVTTIGAAAFSDCFSLSSITIPDSVTNIEHQAFHTCSSATICTIGSGVTSIGWGAFNDCTSLQSVTIKATTPPTIDDGGIFTYTNNCPIYVPAASVETYKTNWRWSTYASRIQAMP